MKDKDLNIQICPTWVKFLNTQNDKWFNCGREISYTNCEEFLIVLDRDMKVCVLVRKDTMKEFKLFNLVESFYTTEKDLVMKSLDGRTFTIKFESIQNYLNYRNRKKAS